MTKSWMSNVNKSELIALIPSKAVKVLDDHDRAPTLIAADLYEKGISPTGVIMMCHPTSPLEPLYDDSDMMKGGKKKPRIKKVAHKKGAKGGPVTPKAHINYINLWKAIDSEFYSLICTKSKRYEQVRKTLDKQGGKATLIIVSTIAGVIGSVLGVVASVCVPFVAYLLTIALSVGKNVFCKITRDGERLAKEMAIPPR
jgi:hypothetical protein